MNEVMSRERAASEIKDWLDYKRIKPSQRENSSNSIDVLTEAVQYGIISVNSSTFEITHKLEVPIDGLANELVYKPRVTVGELAKAGSSTKPIELAASYIAGITGKGLSIIMKMDSEDMKVASAIAGFF